MSIPAFYQDPSHRNI